MIAITLRMRAAVARGATVAHAWRMLVRIVIASSLLVSHATAETVKAPTCGPPPTTPKRVRTVRDVDWCNADVGGFKGALREGHSSVHLYSDMGGPDAAPHDTIATTLRGIVYGDLDGDKRPEAALVIESSTWIGRTGNHSGGTSIRIYSLVRGKPTLLGNIASGTPVRAITLGKGVVTVTSGPNNAETTQRYRRAKDDFTEIQSPKPATP
jgi:hypothetical protein